MNYLKLCILLLVITLTTSFDINSIQKTPEFMLAGSQFKSWKIVKETFNGNDITALRYANCNLDDVYTFYTNSQFIQTEGVSKCYPQSSDTIRTGSWKLVNNKSMLVIESTADTLTFQIDSLTASKAIGTIKTPQGNFQSTFVAY